MNQPVYQQLDQKTIETLKAARNHVVHAGKSRSENEQEVAVAPAVAVAQKSSKGTVEILATGQTQFAARDKFAEEFVRKLSVVEQETAAIDEEMAKMEKIWLNLTEKKKQLENRRNELIKVKDKITTLNKEMDDVLSKEL